MFIQIIRVVLPEVQLMCCLNCSRFTSGHSIIGYQGTRTAAMSLLTEKRQYKGADKSLVRPISRCILFDGKNISSDASLYVRICMYVCIYIYTVIIFLQL
jgi:hypothetical protein